MENLNEVEREKENEVRGTKDEVTRGAELGGRRGGRGRRGIELQRRDLEVLSDLVRFRVMTVEQVRRRHFSRGQTVAESASSLNRSAPGPRVQRSRGTVRAPGVGVAYRRLAALRDAGLVRYRPVAFLAMPGAYTPTKKGREYVEEVAGLAKESFDDRRVRHTLALVDLSEELLAQEPGSSWETEAEFRRDQWEYYKGRPPAGTRSPDGVLVLADGKRVAIELDLTAKTKGTLRGAVKGYDREKGRGAIDRVWWLAASAHTRRRMEEVIGPKDMRADDFVEVRAIPEAVLAGRAAALYASSR